MTSLDRTATPALCRTRASSAAPYRVSWRRPVLEGERCASLHANVAVLARDRRRVERLCRYVAGPPVSTQRLSRVDDGRLLYRLKQRWRDGSTHTLYEPLELLEKLAALVPPPRFHLRPVRPRMSYPPWMRTEPRTSSSSGPRSRKSRAVISMSVAHGQITSGRTRATDDGSSSFTAAARRCRSSGTYSVRSRSKNGSFS
jgi:hypothetical protein